MSLPTKEGHLYKHRTFLRKWTYRYFKLNKTYLHSYETQHCLNPKDSVVRTNITLVEMCNTFPDKVYTFTINSKSQDKWHLAAADESERKDWMDALRAHLPPELPSEASLSEKKSFTLREDGDNPPSPTEPVPPIPGYMASHMQQPPEQQQQQGEFSAPPPYDAACSSSHQASEFEGKGKS